MARLLQDRIGPGAALVPDGDAERRRPGGQRSVGGISAAVLMPEPRDLRLAGSHELPDEPRAVPQGRVCGTTLIAAAQRRVSWRLRRSATDDRFGDDWRALVEETGLVSLLAVPIEAPRRDEPGLGLVFFAEQQSFTDDEIELAHSLAGAARGALEAGEALRSGTTVPGDRSAPRANRGLCWRASSILKRSWTRSSRKLRASWMPTRRPSACFRGRRARRQRRLRRGSAGGTRLKGIGRRRARRRDRAGSRTACSMTSRVFSPPTPSSRPAIARSSAPRSSVPRGPFTACSLSTHAAAGLARREIEAIAASREGVCFPGECRALPAGRARARAECRNPRQRRRRNRRRRSRRQRRSLEYGRRRDHGSAGVRGLRPCTVGRAPAKPRSGRNLGRRRRPDPDPARSDAIWLSVTEAVMRDPAGDVAGRIYAFRNVSSDRLVEKLKSGFVSTVSHELRAPLTSIYGFRRDTSARGRRVCRRGAADLPELHRERSRAPDRHRRRTAQRREARGRRSPGAPRPDRSPGRLSQTWSRAPSGRP